MISMQNDIRDVRRKIGAMVLRAKVTGATAGSRTKVQVAQRSGEVKAGLQLLLPPGLYAVPINGADLLTFTVSGDSDHQIATGGNSLDHAVTDLAPGEVALSNAAGGTQRIALRTSKIELVNTTQIIADSPDIQLGPTGSTLHQLIDDRFRALFNTHTHAGGHVPDQLLDSTHMTSHVTAA